MDVKEFRKYLTKFNYPNINQMSDEEVGQIFSSSNRIFLLSWMANLIEPLLCLDVNSKDTPLLLSNFLYESGFCTKSQKDPFVNGDLPMFDELIIMKKMFSFKDDLDNDNNSIGEVDEPVVSISQLETYFDRVNLSLFPELGPIKSTGSQERHKKIDQLKKSYEETQRQLSNIDKCIVEEPSFDSTDSCEVAEFQEKFMQSDAVQFEIDASVLSQRKRNFCNDDLRLDCDKHVLEKTDENLDSALKMIRDTKAITDFPETNKAFILEESENFDGVAEIAKDTAILSNSVKRVDSYCI